jgi:hypothetical protein
MPQTAEVDPQAADESDEEESRYALLLDVRPLLVSQST